MQPGLTRAVPMAIIGFMVGGLIVIVLRALQSLAPLWDPGTGLILAGFMMAGFFVWGMGAFDKRLSVHGDEKIEEAVHEQIATESAKPRNLLLGSVWQLLTLVLVLLIVVGGFAVLPFSPALKQTIIPGASTTMVGYMPFDLPFGLPQVQVSMIVFFLFFILWAFLSLALVAGVIAYIFNYLARNLTELQTAGATAGGGTAALPAPDTGAGSEIERRETAHDVRYTFAGIGLFIVVFGVLYVLFYNIVFGIVIRNPSLPIVSALLDSPTQQFLYSVIIALVITALVLGRERFRHVIPFVVTFVVLYVVFYYVAIGLIFPNPSLPVLSLFMDNPTQLLLLSLVNAIIFTFLILRTQLVLQFIGIVARWVAFQLRRIPHILQ